MGSEPLPLTESQQYRKTRLRTQTFRSLWGTITFYRTPCFQEYGTRRLQVHMRQDTVYPSIILDTATRIKGTDQTLAYIIRRYNRRQPSEHKILI